MRRIFADKSISIDKIRYLIIKANRNESITLQFDTLSPSISYMTLNQSAFQILGEGNLLAV